MRYLFFLWQAMNLDGGGSSTLVVDKQLINLPQGKSYQRPVVSAIVIKATHEK